MYFILVIVLFIFIFIRLRQLRNSLYKEVLMLKPNIKFLSVILLSLKPRYFIDTWITGKMLKPNTAAKYVKISIGEMKLEDFEKLKNEVNSILDYEVFEAANRLGTTRSDTCMELTKVYYQHVINKGVANFEKFRDVIPFINQPINNDLDFNNVIQRLDDITDELTTNKNYKADWEALVITYLLMYYSDINEKFHSVSNK